MMKIPGLKSKTDPALTRYPEALADLLSLGKPAEDVDYADRAELLREHVPALVEMVLDEDLNQRLEDDPAVWAPLHALGILGVLGPEEAAQPLTQCLDWEDDWISERLPAVYARIGPVAIPVLKACLEDRSRDSWGRSRASRALAAIAQAHADVKSELVVYLADFLGRSDADSSADEERLTTFVIGDLADMEAAAAYPAIQRAFAENRVDEQIITLDGVERHFGMKPPYDFSKLPEPRKEPGVRLVLLCKVCGRERAYLFPKVYYDLGTAKDKKKSARYDPLIIPQRVVCQKCGAVDQYQLAAMGHAAVLASQMAQFKPGFEEFLRPDQRIQFLEFTTRWGPMHPTAAIERYRQELARRPSDSSLQVGYGNVLRFMGRYDEAEREFFLAADLDPTMPEPWINLGQLAQVRGDRDEAIRSWEKALALTHRLGLPLAERQILLDGCRDALTALRSGKPLSELTEFGPVMPPSAAPASAARPIKREAKTGRNDPCPCGSGKKYKHCHGRPGAGER